MYLAANVVKNGFFFTPDNVDRQYPGILTISNGGLISLEITANERAFTTFDERVIGRLIGQVEGGYLTLEQCEYRQSSLSLPGTASKSIISSQLALVGVGLSEPAKFSSFQFCINNLSEWLGKSAFKISIGSSFDEWSIKLQRPDPIEYELSDGTKFIIDIITRVPGGTKYPTMELYQQAYIEITPIESQNLDFFKSLSHRITRFLSFAIGKPVAIHSLKAKIDDPEVNEIHQWSEIYFQSLNNSVQKPLRSDEMLLSFSSISSRLGDLLSLWLREYENLGPALHHYFSVQDDTHAYIDSKFLSMAQALEAFHRRTSNIKKWSNEDYKRKIAPILAACPEVERTWLRERLNFGYELSFGERLHLLIDDIVEVFEGKNNADAIVQGTVRTRNYQAHYDLAGAKKAVKGAHLVSLILRLRVLFALRLLMHLGLTQQEAVELTKTPPLKLFLKSANFIERNNE
ncbi:HEPN domain-containing protein [Pseudomonas salomonii]|uniref:Uncharacterized protein n=1 Tax=Pseudomonas salomonii TaxID=191391 RepID=A0A1H3JE54_9PSED|nr:HEPN domain-containing protein [Pseudomonas salomonii]SDY38192.1 hypothetical protein SAMN05216247_103555 [Pseudomonas salomonii]